MCVFDETRFDSFGSAQLCAGIENNKKHDSNLIIFTIINAILMEIDGFSLKSAQKSPKILIIKS